MFDLEDFKYNFVNLTTFRMVDIEDVGVREVLKNMEKYSMDNNQTINKFMLTQVCGILHYNIYFCKYNKSFKSCKTINFIF